MGTRRTSRTSEATRSRGVAKVTRSGGEEEEQMKAEVEVAKEEAGAGGDEVGMAIVPEDVYRRVGQEVLSSSLEPGCWARALSASDGRHDDAVSQYARLRAEELTEQLGVETRKQQRLECRVASAYRDSKELPPMDPLGVRKGIGFGAVMDAIFWHCVAIVGAVSCLMAVQILWPDLRVHLTVERMVLIIFAFQLFPILGWVAAGRNGFYPAMSYPQTAHMSACVVVVCSLSLGGYLLTHPEATDGGFSPDSPAGSVVVMVPGKDRVPPVVQDGELPTKAVRLVSSGGE